MELIEPRNLFYHKTEVVYPPFKNGLYMEEYFFEKIMRENPTTKRKYIPAFWTNFQIENWFQSKKNSMQYNLDLWVKRNPSPSGYFTVVQHDDAVFLILPPNTIIYGACSGNIPLPLIYQDVSNTLENIPRKSFNEKKILCSFVGSITTNHIQPYVRHNMINYLINNPNFILNVPSGWTNNVDKQKQNTFIMLTSNSKFALAPRGYGRSSFRFFEILQLGVIPIYIWNDVEWLPYKDDPEVDYSKFCISINISEINKLENILLNINEDAYNNMLNEYNKIKHKFSLDGMYNYIITHNTHQ
jgi:hypothetical protein